MTHRRRPRRHDTSGRNDPSGNTGKERPSSVSLEIVLKADTQGTLEAVAAAVSRIAAQGVGIVAVERAVGDVSKSDLTMALTGSRLVLGFEVDPADKTEELAKAYGVEVRLYRVVDHLAKDLAAIARSLAPAAEEEVTLGQARVIALFKSSRKGIILGCEVLRGRLALGKAFRVIGAAGPIYSGVIESLHIEADAVTLAKPGQKVGLKVRDFHGAEIGDLVESYEVHRTAERPWAPRPGVFRVGTAPG